MDEAGGVLTRGAGRAQVLGSLDGGEDDGGARGETTAPLDVDTLGLRCPSLGDATGDAVVPEGDGLGQ